MSDFQKIGDSLICIRVIGKTSAGENVLHDQFLKKNPCEDWWTPITHDEWLAAKAELDKVPS